MYMQFLFDLVMFIKTVCDMIV